MIIVNALFPVLALLLAGCAFKRWKLTNQAFLAASDRLVYYVFFPLMLFWKIGSAPFVLASGGWRYLLASGLAVILVCGASLVFIRRRPVAPFKAGSFNQGCYRFNTYIGMAVALNAFGESGVQLYSILVGILVPLINVLCVPVLIWFSEENAHKGNRLVFILKQLLVNPLILACVLGILYSRLVGFFPIAVENSLKLFSQVTLPLALFSIGGSLTFTNLRANMELAFFASLFKLIALPFAGLCMLALLGVTGLAWKVSLLFFALPTSTAIYILSSQLRSDIELASGIIVMSTLLSFVSMSVVLLLV